MNDRAPKVSIGLVVYNGENYLAEAVESLLAQTFTDFELIISDNGSSDRTPAISHAYADRDVRIRCVRSEENRGCAWNYNRVLELARGEYFMWAAHDDLWRPEFLARTVRELNEHVDVVRCFCRHAHVDAASRPLSDVAEITFVEAGGSIPPRDARLPRQRLASVLFSDSGEDIYALTRTEALRDTCGYRPIYGSEKILIAELSFRGQYREVPEVLYASRVHGEASGCITTAAGLQEYIDPKSRRRFAFIRLRLLLGHLHAVARAPLSLSEKFACFGQIARYLFQWSKWKRVATGALRGSGNGGGYLKHLHVRSTAAPFLASTAAAVDARDTDTNQTHSHESHRVGANPAPSGTSST